MANEPDKFWAVTHNEPGTRVEERPDQTLTSNDAAIFKDREQANQFFEAEIRRGKDRDWQAAAGSEDFKWVVERLLDQAVAVHPQCWTNYGLIATAEQMTDTCQWLCIMCGIKYGPNAFFV